MAGERPILGVVKCGKCPADVVWATSEKGKPVIFDVPPGDGGKGYAIGPDGVARYSKEHPKGTPVYTSHWATCPAAKQVRAETDAKRAGGGA